MQLNQGIPPSGQQPVFSEVGQLAGIESTDWSWSPLFADMDNDGWKDLLITNGYPRDITNLDFAAYKANLMMHSQFNDAVMQELIKAINNVDGAYLPNFFYRNQGDWTFKDLSDSYGFNIPSFSHGAAVADLDMDGDLDYIVNNTFDPVFIYENRSQQILNHHFLRINLEGPFQKIGTKVWVHQDSAVQYQELYPFRGFQSTVEPILHFGLGKNPRVDSMIIQWPDGTRQLVYEPKTNQALTIFPSKQVISHAPPKNQPDQTLFSKEEHADFTHQDPHYSDFKVMPLLLHKYSQLGPKLTVGDVNGDGLEDVFIGGGFRQSGVILIQTTNGTFTSIALDPDNTAMEDLDAAFLDVDLDGDLDLYVASGSSEFPKNSPLYQDRLYLNDGQGNFILDSRRLPVLNTSSSCVTAGDYDNDGDVDLFVGGLPTLENYPIHAGNILLENKQGYFSVAKDQLNFKFPAPSIIKDATWKDYNGDGKQDLIVVGEWMPITLFKNTGNGGFENVTASVGLSNTIGWWNGVLVEDLDGDGDLDIVGGNHGLNTFFRATSNETVSIYLDDFDKNQKLDPIITYHLQGQEVPFAFRDDLLNWIFPLKKTFTSYEQYADTNWDMLFPEVEAQRTSIDHFATMWFKNEGNHFEIVDFPKEVQLAPVKAIASGDYNTDGIIDLLMVGNTSAPNPQIGHLDASHGLFLEGLGKGRFKSVRMQESGFYVPGEGRDIAAVKTALGSKRVLVARNNNSIISFKLEMNRGTN